jgi:hypothetical protein
LLRAGHSYGRALITGAGAGGRVAALALHGDETSQSVQGKFTGHGELAVRDAEPGIADMFACCGEVACPAKLRWPPA